jgi:hypothetical protein
MRIWPIERRSLRNRAATGLAGPATLPRPLSRHTLALALTGAMLVIVAPPGAAQPAAGAAGPSEPPARIDNHYNHKAYQPTTSAVCDRAGSDSIDCASPAGKDAAAKLENVQRQLDELAKEYPPEAPSGSSDGRR